MGGILIVSSQCKHALAMLNDGRIPIYSIAISPNGLVGAYPVWLGAEGAKLALPDGITLDEAIKINLGGQLRDGIEEIRGDGTIVLSGNVVKVMISQVKGQQPEGWRLLLPFFGIRAVQNPRGRVACATHTKIQASISKCC